MDTLINTEKSYGFLWSKHKISPPQSCHFDKMQEVIDKPIVKGSIGIDVGSGCGYDTYVMASRNPAVDIVSVDLSDGVYRTKKLTLGLKNVRIIKCSVLDLSLKSNFFDFAYSFGALHHTSNPASAFLEVNRILKRRCPVFLYLYEDHSENRIKFFCLRLITVLRKITTKIPHIIMYILSWICSPLVFLFFSLPSRIMRNFRATEKLAIGIPFNFGRGLFSLWGDLYDRFTAPIEYRFSKQEVYDLLTKCNFSDIIITKLKESAGWVAWAYKK